eukprot:GEZU01022539.1.p1 GENE.GEZU01022539.1~~GEZU01022539.1.p1  ORF type:complete len:226 (+),score=34.69 GEZU01022539.1:298-975(+)
MSVMQELRSQKMQWTSLMQEMMHRIAEEKTMQEVELCLAGTPMTEPMKQVFRRLKQQDHDCRIVSDANTYFINVILASHGVSDCVTQVISNPASHDGKRLTITRYRTVDNPHSCKICSINMCKGEIVTSIATKDGSYDQVIYVGDGQNDFCPLTYLSTNDLAFVRRNYALEKLLQRDTHISKVRAKVHYWTTHDELLLLFETFVFNDDSTSSSAINSNVQSSGSS